MSFVHLDPSGILIRQIDLVQENQGSTTLMTLKLNGGTRRGEAPNPLIEHFPCLKSLRQDESSRLSELVFCL